MAFAAGCFTSIIIIYKFNGRRDELRPTRIKTSTWNIYPDFICFDWSIRCFHKHHMLLYNIYVFMYIHVFRLNLYIYICIKCFVFLLCLREFKIFVAAVRRPAAHISVHSQAQQRRFDFNIYVCAFWMHRIRLQDAMH